MFTGIVEELGEVVSLKGLRVGRELSVKGGVVISSLKIGESIAVDGVCLPLLVLKRIYSRPFLARRHLSAVISEKSKEVIKLIWRGR